MLAHDAEQRAFRVVHAQDGLTLTLTLSLSLTLTLILTLTLTRAFDASTTATAALVLEADVNNETTVATASQLLNSVRSLASTGHKALTKDALQQTLEQFNELCTTMVPPEPEPEPEPDAARRKPKKKKKKAKKAGR